MLGWLHECTQRGNRETWLADIDSQCPYCGCVMDTVRS